MGIYGYVRKGYPDTLINQLKLVQKYQCDELFIEEESFKNDQEFVRLTETLNENDFVVIPDIRVFGKSIRQMTLFFDFFDKKNIKLVSVLDNLDTSKEDFSFYRLANIFSKMDHSYHVRQTQKGIEKARENGITGGRPKISDESIKEIQTLYAKNQYSLRKIAEMCSVSLGTVHKYIR